MKTALALVWVTEQEEVRAGRQGNVHPTTGLYCAVDDAKANALLWRSPSTEGNTAATSEHAKCLTEESLRVREMRHPEVADHRIEAGPREEE